MVDKVYSNKKSSFFQKRISQTYEAVDTSDLYPSFPKTSLIELSNSCNHACIFCANPRMKRKVGFLDLKIYEKFIKEAVPLGLREVGLYSTGEPFLSKNLNDYIRIAKEAGATYIYITTNGALAKPEKMISAIDAGLDSIKFSVNAGTRESYKLVHGKDDFDKVVDNIKFISNYREERDIGLILMASSVITKYTEDDKEMIKDLLLPLVDDLAFYGVSSQFGQSSDQLDLIRSSMTDNPPEPGTGQPCPMVWNRIHVTREGYLSLCCGDYENALIYADLNSSSVKEAWHNYTITEMRRKHQCQQLDKTLCKNCIYGTREKVYPLTDIGHEAAAKPLISNKDRGVKAINERISKLDILKDFKK